MKKMKRLIALVLAGVLALAMLTACGGSVPGDTTEKIVMEKCTEYAREALKKAGTTVVEDAELQQIAAEAVRTNWKEDEADVVPAKAKDGSTVIISWTGNAFSNQDLPALTAAKGAIVEMVKNQDDLYYQRFGTHAQKATVYTAAHGNEVLVAFALQFPKTSG